MSEIFSEIFSGIGSGGGGSPLLFWDPLATQGEFGYQNIEAGVKKAGTYNIINNPTQTTIDGVPQNTSIGTTIAFIDNGSGWSIISQTSQQAKYTSPSSVADETVLNATFPIPEDYEGQYCYVQSTNTYWTVKLEGLNWIWYDTGEVSVETYSKTEQDALFQANSTTDRNRANHIGTQLASTISDFDAEVENNTEVLANTTARHSHTNKAILDGTQESFTTALKTNYDTSYTHIASTTNPHSVTKAQVGLGNVDNTSDVDKPISTAQQNALDTKVDKVVGKQLSTEDYTTVEKNKLAGIQEGAEVNIQADWEQADNLQDSFIQNKPTLGTVASKDVGTAVGNIQENGAILGNSQIVETDATGKFITTSKNTAYNKNFGTLNGEVAQGDASYLKADTYTKTEIDNSLNLKQNTSEKGQANGYASLNGTGKVPASQLPSFVDDVLEYADVASFPATGETGKVYVALDTNLTYRWSGSVYVKLNDVDLTNYFNKVTDTTDNITEGTAKFTTQADIDKLAGIEANATADQTAAEIKIAYESNADTNAFTDAEKTNLSNQSGTNTGDETTSSIQTKRPLKTIEGQSLEGSGNIDLTKSDVDLGNVDNTSDVDKPVSTAQQLALDGKLAKGSNLSDVNNQQTALNNITNVAGATNEYVLTKDTTTGDALWKAAAGGGGSGGTTSDIYFFKYENGSLTISYAVNGDVPDNDYYLSLPSNAIISFLNSNLTINY